jgi:uncharacterized protein
MTLTVRVLDAITDLPEARWDGLLDPSATPFVQWAFLEALESSGCASPRHGWRPRHLTLWRDEALIAAAPAYAKSDWEGDFARDWNWASHAALYGVRYYPRLLITVPITPVPGRRILVAPGEDRASSTAALIAGARALATEERLSSVHVLYAQPDELPHLEAAGMVGRVDFQAHWFNRGYKDPADWLARGLDAKKRHLVRKERALPAKQGITLRTVRGEEISSARETWGRAVHGLYQATLDKMGWGRPWLNAAFFLRIFERMPEHLEVVEARREGRLIAGAFNVAAGGHLYGRYWGCHEEHDSLHFNVCLHHSIDDCIARGIEVFEGGAGGQHKLHRGFSLAATHGAHMFLDARLHRDLGRAIALETAARMLELTLEKRSS